MLVLCLADPARRIVAADVASPAVGRTVLAVLALVAGASLLLGR